MCFKDLGSDPSITEIKEASVKEATVKGEDNKSAHNRPIWQQNLVKFFKSLSTPSHKCTLSLFLWHFNPMLCAFITLPHISLCNFLGCCRNNASAVLLDNNSDLSLFLLLQVTVHKSWCDKFYTVSLVDKAHHSQCLILSAKAPSGMAFFRKLSMDFSNAARCGKHCTPVTTQSSVSILRQLTLLTFGVCWI